jgi:hypothetical protein
VTRHRSLGTQFAHRLHETVTVEPLGDLIEQFLLSSPTGGHQRVRDDHQVGVGQAVHTRPDDLVAHDRCGRGREQHFGLPVVLGVAERLAQGRQHQLGVTAALSHRQHAAQSLGQHALGSTDVLGERRLVQAFAHTLHQQLVLGRLPRLAVPTALRGHGCLTEPGRDCFHRDRLSLDPAILVTGCCQWSVPKLHRAIGV